MAKVFEYDPEKENKGEPQITKPSVRSVASKRGFHSYCSDSEEKESTLDRYIRIKDEICTFQRKLGALSSLKTSSLITANDVANDINSARARLENNTWQPAVSILSRAGLGVNQSGKGLGYEVYADSGPSPYLKQDRALSRLERRIGQSASFESLYDRLNNLCQRADVLNEHKFDRLLSRTKHLLTEVDTTDITEEVAQMSIEGRREREQIEKEKQDKVEAIAKVIGALGASANRVPQTANRLKCQQSLHDQSANVLKRINLLRQKQDAVTALLHRDISSLNMVQTSLAENLAVMKKNAESLKARV